MNMTGSNYEVSDIVLFVINDYVSLKVKKLRHEIIMKELRATRQARTPVNMEAIAVPFTYWEMAAVFTSPESLLTLDESGHLKEFDFLDFCDYCWNAKAIVLRPNLPVVQKKMAVNRARVLLENTDITDNLTYLLSTLSPLAWKQIAYFRRDVSLSLLNRMFEYAGVYLGSGGSLNAKNLDELTKSVFLKRVF